MTHPLTRYIVHNHFIAGILLIALGWFLLEIRGILAAFFISYIIMAALSPFTAGLKQRKLPHVLAVLIPYLTTLFFVVLLVFPLIPFFVSQFQLLITNFPLYFDAAAKVFGISVDQAQIQSIAAKELDTIGRNAFSVTTKLFGGVFSTLTVLVVSFYLLLDRERITNDFVSVFPRDHQKKAHDIFKQIEEKLGAWLRGQIVLSFSIGVLTWIALTALQLQFALPLALIAGILEAVPTIGPIIASIPAVIVALSVSPEMAILVVVVYIVIQALENNLLVPKIMEKAVGFNPIVVILAITIGARLMGVVGALLSIPFIAMVLILVRGLQTYDS